MERQLEFLINQNHKPLFIKSRDPDLLTLLQSDNVWNRIEAFKTVKHNKIELTESCFPCIVSIPEGILQSVKIENEHVTFDENFFIVNKMSKMISMIEPASYVQYAKNLFKSYRNKVTWCDYVHE